MSIVFYIAVCLCATDSEDTEPAPDGRLISTEERMQQIRNEGTDLKTEAEAGVY